MTTSRNLAKLGSIVNSDGNINLTGTANVTLGAIGNLKITGGLSGQAITTDGTGNLSWANATGGGSSTAKSTKTYYWKGGLIENVSTLRFYIPYNATLTDINTNLGAAGLSQSTFVVKKNGTIINTITVSANSTSNYQSVSIALLANDYLTVDITQSSTAKDAYVTFIYN